MDNTKANLDRILQQYCNSFSEKIYSDENNDHDILMDVFGMTPEMKRENRQYWGRELGKCWEYLVIEACRSIPTFEEALRIGNDEPCDLRFNGYAIDTKYRLGSGDSGTLKKFKEYGPLLKEKGYKPIFLFLRQDNLPAAINACIVGGWEIKTGLESFDFIKKHSKFDLKKYLENRSHHFPINY